MPRTFRNFVPALVGATALLAAACSGDNGGDPPPQLTSCATTDASAPTTMAVGQVRVFSASALNCVKLPGGSTGAQYMAIVGNTNTAFNVRGDYRLNADFGAAAALQAAASGDRAALLAQVTAPARPHDVHERLMAEARKLDVAGARAEWQRQRAAGPRGIRNAIFQVSPTVGTTAEIRVPSLRSGDAPCTVFSTITATVRYVSARSIIVVDNESPTNGFQDADYASIANEFDNLIYTTDVAYFGNGSDIDANSKIVILYTPKVNAATPRNSSSLLAGFFWAGDLFPRTGSNSCSQSNQAELFYLLVPDPSGTFSSARTVADVREKTRGTIAHEFQHMLNAGWRLSNAPAFEDVWLDEALAHFAEEAVGRAKIGAGDYEELNDARIADVGNNRRDYFAFFYQNLARYSSWLRAPGAAAPIDTTADTSLAVRGAAWSLLRYSMDHYTTDARAFTRTLANSRSAGLTNLRAALGTGVPLDSVLTGWQVASFADNLSIPGLPGRFEFRSWNMRDAVNASQNTSTYPLLVNQLALNQSPTGSVRSGGGAAYYRVPVPPSGLAALQLANGAGTSVGFTGAKLTVVRTQ